MRKVLYNSEDYLMLLSSTGQPSFYPEGDEEKDIKDNNKGNDNNKEVEDNNIQLNKEMKKGSIDYGEKSNDNNNKNIFDFH